VDVRRGVVWVRSPYVCQGYAGAPGTLQVDGDGYVTAGDRGWFADGHLVVTGRGDAVVNTGGAAVQVADVESVLRPVVTGDVVVVGVPHHELGEVVAAVLTDALSFPGARALARATLAPTQQPRLWFEVRELPLTTAGKVDRTALSEMLDTRGESARRLT
jgi:acyl-CoA synthetase (AMP-forming)/AMP-acid ligase II